MTWYLLYIENPKDTFRKLLELISEFSKVAGHKISTQKSLAFLYTNNKKLEREIKESILFTIGTKRIKYLGITSSFILLSFAWVYIFFSAVQVLLPALIWCFACTSVSEGVFLMYPWREMYLTSTYCSTILFSSNLPFLKKGSGNLDFYEKLLIFKWQLLIN